MPRPAVFVLLVATLCGPLDAHPHHEHGGHGAATYEVTKPIEVQAGEKHLRLRVVDRGTGKPTAARFTLAVDGNTYVPAGLGPHGLRFVSIHQGKNQRFVATYARGTGEVLVPLPRKANRGIVFVTKGYDYLPQEVPFDASGDVVKVTATIRRWTDIQRQGWLPADEHLHYDRTEAVHDKDWLTMMAGDDLAHAHFLVLKGGNLPGIWAKQYAYGKPGEASDGRRLIRPGEEYRDGYQGHINLLGIREVIPPISTGGIGKPAVPQHYPPLYDVFVRARGWAASPARRTAGRCPATRRPSWIRCWVPWTSLRFPTRIYTRRASGIS